MGDGSFIKTSDLAADNIDASMFVNTQRTLNQEHLSRELMPMEWTNEKHSLYLKSMEASFVNDLYNSVDLLRYQIGNPLDTKLLKQKHPASSTSSGQFKVLRRGCWEKINFERNRSRSSKAEETGDLVSNPWIRHFRSSCGHQIVASSTLHEKVALATDQSSYDSVEVTDQNFVDEEDMEEKSSYTSNPKRIKIENSYVPTPINDQVVTLAMFSEFADVTDES